jgi:hypothetical protein
MEIIYDGRYDFKKALIQDALQNCDVTFSMKDVETGILKVSKAPAAVVDAKMEGCEEKFILEYKWSERDTRKEGIYEGWFNIDFLGDLISGDGTSFPSGQMTVPIQEDLIIYVR